MTRTKYYDITFKHEGKTHTAIAYTRHSHEPFYWIQGGKYNGCGVHTFDIISKKLR